MRWLVSEGDFVEADEPICEMINEKAEFEMWPTAPGVVRGIYAAENSTVPVGYIIAAVGAEGEEVPDVAAENDALIARARAEQTAVGSAGGGALTGAAGERAVGTSSRVRATPAARRLAREKGVDLADLKAELGIERAITAEDVERRLAGGGPELGGAG